MLNRSLFYAKVRDTIFGGRLVQSQVNGMESVLDEWGASACTDLRFLAYIFAGMVRETGRKMEPVREGFAADDATARAMAYAHSYGKPVNGVVYYGRGRLQNTWVYNYQKLQKRFNKPFVTQPDLLLDDKTDAEVTLYGHVEGIWTGRKLGDYFNDYTEDPVGARHIVNGTDHATEIAGYYWSFKTALTTAWSDKPWAPAPVTVDHPNTPDPLKPMVPPAPKIEPLGSAANASLKPAAACGVAVAAAGTAAGFSPIVIGIVAVVVIAVAAVLFIKWRRKQTKPAVPAPTVPVKK